MSDGNVMKGQQCYKPKQTDQGILALTGNKGKEDTTSISLPLISLPLFHCNQLSGSCSSACRPWILETTNIFKSLEP